MGRNDHHGGKSFVGEPGVDLAAMGDMPQAPEPPYPCVKAYENREDAFERYLLALAEYNHRYGTTIEPITDCW